MSCDIISFEGDNGDRESWCLTHDAEAQHPCPDCKGHTFQHEEGCINS